MIAVCLVCVVEEAGTFTGEVGRSRAVIAKRILVTDQGDAVPSGWSPSSLLVQKREIENTDG